MAATLERMTNRADWLALRRSGVGASESACLLGWSPFGTAATVWASKVGVGVDIEETVVMRRGRQLESAVARILSDETGLEVVHHGDHVVARAADHPRLLCTLDREIRHPVLGPGVAELKTSRRGEDWPPDDVSGLDTVFTPRDVPRHYYAQVQHQMMVTGATWGVLACLSFGHRFVYGKIEPDADIQRAIRLAVDDFWPYVEKNERPPITGGPGESDLLRAMFRRETDGKLVALPDIAVEWDAQLQQAKEAKKNAEGAIETFGTLLRGAIGDAEIGVLPNGAAYTLRLQERKAHMVKASSGRVLRRKGDE